MLAVRHRGDCGGHSLSLGRGGIQVKLWDKFSRIEYIRPIAVVAIIAAICLILFSLADEGEKGVETFSTQTPLESRLADVLSAIDGVGEVKVLINEDEGVLVVARGAGDIAVRLEIIRAVKALLGAPSERIEVLAMGG